MMNKLAMCTLLISLAAEAMPEDAPLRTERLVMVEGHAYLGRAPMFPATREACDLWEDKALLWDNITLIAGGLGGASTLSLSLFGLAFKRKTASIVSAAFLAGAGGMSMLGHTTANSYKARHLERCTVDVSGN